MSSNKVIIVAVTVIDQCADYILHNEANSISQLCTWKFYYTVDDNILTMTMDPWAQTLDTVFAFCLIYLFELQLLGVLSSV